MQSQVDLSAVIQSRKTSDASTHTHAKARSGSSGGVGVDGGSVISGSTSAGRSSSSSSSSSPQFYPLSTSPATEAKGMVWCDSVTSGCICGYMTLHCTYLPMVILTRIQIH